MFNIIGKRKIWFTLSGLAVAVGLVFFLIWKLNLGIDFTGGSLMEVEFPGTRPANSEIVKVLTESRLLNSIHVQPIGSQGMILRFENVSEQTHQDVLNKLKESFGDQITETKFDSIGPIIGQELKQKTIYAIIIALIGMILYISWSFRKVSKPVASWKYGLIAIITLFHDIVITIGIFSFLGRFYQVEVNAPFIAALLTILGYSVNDTIVIFDRIRENLTRHYEGNFEAIVERSVHESIIRSINTSLTTLLVLLAILTFGGATIRNFVLALIIGIIIGTYSSVFLASPLLVTVQKIFKSKEV
jgi:preprotein translocase subunit SecF